MASNNPISRGYAAIEAAFAAWTPLTALVRSGNRAAGNLQTPGYQPRTQVQAGDRPEFKLAQRLLPFKPLKRNSVHVMLGCDYVLTIPSGRFGIDLANLLVIEAGRALLDYGAPTFLLRLDDILSDWGVSPAQFTAKDPQSQRPEWTAVLTISLEFSMPRAAFLAATFT